MEKIIETNWDEIWPISNILNEVCNGFEIPNFEIALGFDYETIYALLRKLKNYRVNETEFLDPVILKLNEFEVEIIKVCYRAALKEIEEWEFPIRIGISIDEANTLKNKFLR